MTLVALFDHALIGPLCTNFLKMITSTLQSCVVKFTRLVGVLLKNTLKLFNQ